MKNSWAYFCLSAFLLQIGCGGTTSKPEVSSVTVSPSAVALGLGQPAQFQAMVSGSTGGVVWSVNGTTGGNATVGTIDANGNYTAPTNSQSVEVAITATSASDPSASATAQAYVVAPGTVAATANPQVALYTIAPPAAANVTIQFGPTTAYGKSTWTQTSPAGGGSVGTFVAGMLASTAYHMQATVQFPGGITFTDTDHAFTTGAVSMTGLPTITATTTAGMTPQSGVELVDLTTIPVVVTDLAGRILWKYTPSISIASGNLVNPIKLLPNGHFLINYGGNTPDGVNSVMQEVDLSGQVVWQMTAAQLNQELATATCSGCNITVVGTHHDFAILPNGHIIVIASTQQMVSGTTVTGDVLIDLDQNRNPVWLWNEFDHLDINRRPYL
ncbi:MAG: aryl-sulfate sulfotransferase, partial [Candidatus Acidiferrales bacterium]